jgi:hypothetical protein
MSRLPSTSLGSSVCSSVPPATEIYVNLYAAAAASGRNFSRNLSIGANSSFSQEAIKTNPIAARRSECVIECAVQYPQAVWRHSGEIANCINTSGIREYVRRGHIPSHSNGVVVPLFRQTMC